MPDPTTASVPGPRYPDAATDPRWVVVLPNNGGMTLHAADCATYMGLTRRPQGVRARPATVGDRRTCWERDENNRRFRVCHHCYPLASQPDVTAPSGVPDA